MTHEAGIWIFCIIALVCLSVWLLCRRSNAVLDVLDEAMYGETPKPLPKGWQGWEGGEQPVPDDTMVVVMLRSGHISPIDLASVWGWDHAPGRAWSGYDIVAWRVA